MAQTEDKNQWEKQGAHPFADPLENKVYDYILKNRLLRSGCHVVVGVSGGADSVCLLFLLYEFQAIFHLQITVVHVHHGIRGESADRDAGRTEELCSSLAVPCLVFREDVPGYAKEQGLSEEEAGRIVRYRLLNRVREEEGADLIAVAHHGDDNAETVLWNLIRGTGLGGLGGMLPVRNDIIRPLLCCKKKELLDYLKRRRISWCEDETNELPGYTRNRLRLEILPVLDQINPKASEHICYTAETVSEVRQWMELEAEKWIDLNGKADEGQTILPAAALHKVHRALRMQLYLMALSKVNQGNRSFGDLEKGALHNLSRRHLLLIDDLLGQAHNAAVQLPEGLWAWRRYDSLVLGKRRGQQERFSGAESQEAEKLSEADFPFVWKIPEGLSLQGFLRFQLLSWNHGEAGNDRNVDICEKIPEKMYTKWFDYDKIKNTLSVRTRKTGDYIRIMPGYGKKTVKAFMIDEKIPREDRDRICLLADGSHILWIVGYRVSEKYKVTEHTKTILQVQMRKV